MTSQNKYQNVFGAKRVVYLMDSGKEQQEQNAAKSEKPEIVGSVDFYANEAMGAQRRTELYSKADKQLNEMITRTASSEYAEKHNARIARLKNNLERAKQLEKDGDHGVAADQAEHLYQVLVGADRPIRTLSPKEVAEYNAVAAQLGLKPQTELPVKSEQPKNAVVAPKPMTAEAVALKQQIDTASEGILKALAPENKLQAVAKAPQNAATPAIDIATLDKEMAKKTETKSNPLT